MRAGVESVCVCVCVSIPKVGWMLRKCLVDLGCLRWVCIHLGCELEVKHGQRKDGKHGIQRGEQQVHTACGKP